jgi:hypothetical protein
MLEWTTTYRGAARWVAVVPIPLRWRTTLRVGPVCLGVFAGSCASVSSQTPLMRATELRVAASELRTTENALAISIPPRQPV